MSEVTHQQYRTGTFPITAMGFSGVVSGTARWVRGGHHVHLFLPVLQGISNATTFTVQPLPEVIRPSGPVRQVVAIEDNGSYTAGLVELTAGTLTLKVHPTVDLGMSAWTPTGPKSLLPCVVHYLAIPGQAAAA